jgi:peptidoglycan/LPS O-acetylase OafA/YrhL
VEKLTAVSYLRQLLLVQLWFEPFFDGTSWDGPAWSISAEWLAYLIFGAIVLVVWRVERATRARGLLLAAFAATLPPLLLLVASGAFYTPWSWLPRIIMQFTAGALACAAVRKLKLTDRGRRGAGYLSLLLVGLLVGALYWFDGHPLQTVRDDFGLVDVLFLPLVVSLSVGIGSLPRLLSTRILVYGGSISFSLYMVHELVHTTWNWTVAQFEISLTPSPSAKLTVLGLIAVAFIGAIVLYHVVEEPARRWMRSMVDGGTAKPEVNHATSDEDENNKLQPIHGVRDTRPDDRPARAG